MRVLAIGAHPDDVEFLCAGTLAKMARRKDEVVIAVATNGEVGSPTLSREETSALRWEEALRAADVIGAELIWMGFPDEWLFNDLPTRRAFIDVVRRARPDVMFVHSLNDYHPDHRNAGQTAVDARIPAAVRLVQSELPHVEQIPHVFFMDNLGGVDFVPEFYVDITEVMPVKERMLAQHQSQDTWLQHLYGMSYIDFMRSHAARRGAEHGVAFAEGFRSLRTYPVTGTAAQLP